jgi:hypothetical protein
MYSVFTSPPWSPNQALTPPPRVAHADGLHLVLLVAGNTLAGCGVLDLHLSWGRGPFSLVRKSSSTSLTKYRQDFFSVYGHVLRLP